MKEVTDMLRGLEGMQKKVLNGISKLSPEHQEELADAKLKLAKAMQAVRKGDAKQLNKLFKELNANSSK